MNPVDRTPTLVDPMITVQAQVTAFVMALVIAMVTAFATALGLAQEMALVTAFVMAVMVLGLAQEMAQVTAFAMALVMALAVPAPAEPIPAAISLRVKESIKTALPVNNRRGAVFL